MKKVGTIAVLTVILAVVLFISGCVDEESSPADLESIGIDATEDWCVAGTEWSYTDADVAITWEIVGLEQFKDKEYCKATAVAEDGIELTNTWYYFDKDNQDIWYVIEIDGALQETHVASPSE